MDQLDNNTFIQQVPDESLNVYVGDKTQDIFYPRVKIEKWNNESNISVGFDDTPDGATVTQEGEKVLFEKENVVIEAYPIYEDKKTLTSIRRVLAGDEITAVAATAEYEMFNQIGQNGQMLMAHYVVTEPSVAVFDNMPSSKHLNVFEENGVVYAEDFDYKDKSEYHPSDVPISSYDKVRVCRFYTPYNTFINPYYMDSGLHNIDIQWKGSNFAGCINQLHDAIIQVFATKGIEIIKAKDLNKQLRQKLYFRHGDRLVKFFSAQEEEQGLYAYINIASAYNKAYDFYRPDVDKDIRNDYAYGIQHAYPEIGHEIVNEIMLVLAAKLKLPLNDTPYNLSEQSTWQQLQTKHAQLDWIANATRPDANYVFMDKIYGFELLKSFKKKPNTNEIGLTVNTPKDAVGYYQAELDFEYQAREQVRRSPQAAKSIAIYHPEKQNNEYKAGKIAHIYRPFAWDANGLRVACHFKETEALKDGEEVDLSNGLTIVVPQWFLDKATYPISIDPTFGYTTAGASTQSFSDTVLASVQSSGSITGRISSISAYINLTTSTGSTLAAEMALYDSSGNFNHLAQTGNVSGDVGTGWQSRATNTFYPIGANTDYLLAVWGIATAGQGPVGNLYYDSTGGKTSYSLSSSYVADTWPATLSGATTQSNRQYSIYATYGYQFPIMVGSSVAMAATARYQPPMVAHDNAWSTTEAIQQALSPSAADFTKLKVILTTAPGAGTTRTISARENEAATSLAVTIADTATSGSDDQDAASYVLNTDRLSIGNANTVGTPASSTVNRWRFVQTGQYQIWFCNSSATTSTTANRFMVVQGTGSNAATGPATQVVPESGTLQNFVLRMSATLSAGSYTCTLVKNGVDTSVVIVLDSTNQQATYSSTTVTVAAGDTIYWKIVPSAGPAPSATVRIFGGCEYASDIPGNGVLLSNQNANASNSATVFNNWYGDGAWNATESNVQALGVGGVKITKLYVALSASPGAGKNRAITFRDNGANTFAAVTIADSNTNGTWEGVVYLSDDDLICVQQTPTGTPTASSVKYGIVFTMQSTPQSMDWSIRSNILDPTKTKVTAY